MACFPRRLNGADVWGVRLAPEGKLARSHSPQDGTDLPPPRLSGLGVILIRSEVSFLLTRSHVPDNQQIYDLALQSISALDKMREKAGTSNESSLSARYLVAPKSLQIRFGSLN